MSRFGQRVQKITTLCLMLEEGAAASTVETNRPCPCRTNASSPTLFEVISGAGGPSV
jgi:hypothetical protein